MGDRDKQASHLALLSAMDAPLLGDISPVWEGAPATLWLGSVEFVTRQGLSGNVCFCVGFPPYFDFLFLLSLPWNVTLQPNIDTWACLPRLFSRES